MGDYKVFMVGEGSIRGGKEVEVGAAIACVVVEDEVGSEDTCLP